MAKSAGGRGKLGASVVPEVDAGAYLALVSELKTKISQARLRAGLAVNRELVLLYWEIGREILARQQNEGWGAKVIERLGADLGRAFPEMTGFSPRNLKYMRAFADAWPDPAIVQQLVAQLPWGHNFRLVEGVKSETERVWYARQCVEHGWSRNVLDHQISSELYARQGGAITNFARTLPAPKSELAQQLLKDPYTFDFLSLGPDVLERDLERGLVDHLRELIMELGKGFAFVGSQYHLEVGGQDYYLDLLFYHLRLRCFVVIELKIEDFKPEFAGKMNFYLSAVDAQLRHPDDLPTIGIILCKGRNEVIVEYALRDSSKPIGVAQYRLSSMLPPQLQQALPTIEDLSREFPLMAVAKLRIEIESALRRLASAHGAVELPVGVASLLKTLQGLAVIIPGTEQFLDALAIMNQAAHGIDFDPGKAAEAMEAGGIFLKTIHTLMAN